ncbi:hypothetical protein AAG906_039085 [Vitis piasezkii]
MGHLTRLSVGDTDVDDENERDEEDDRNDAINTDEIHLPNDDENCCERENIDLVMVQQVVEFENTRYVNLEVGDRSNNPKVEFEVENTSLIASPHDLQHVVKMFSIKSRQEFIVYRSNVSVLVLKCKKAPNMFRITKYKGPHTCLDSSFVFEYIETLVKTEMTITIAKRKVMTRLFGDWYKSYSNPGCIVYSKMVPGNNLNEEIFQRVFWAFTPSIKGFTHCRPVLSIDGTHLYGKYKGTLLIAMGCDNTDSWSWFLACIRVEVTQRKGLCLISDRHPGIIASDAYYIFCMRHLASNFNTKFKDKTLKDIMCRAAMESKVKKFISQMDTIDWINAEARNWLEHIPLEKWAFLHDGGRRYGIMTTNMSKVFNGVLKGAHNLPITALVQLTLYRVNNYFTVRREHGVSQLTLGEEFTPYIEAKIKAKVVKAGSHEVVLYDHVDRRFHLKTRHSVGSNNRKPCTYHVTLQTGSCTCNKTLLLGFPCLHILAACHCYYTTRVYLSTWAPLFYLIFDELEWSQYNGPIIIPSDSMKRLTFGPPKSSRLHNEMDARETRTPQTCGLCKPSSHNRCSCPKRETNNKRS